MNLVLFEPGETDRPLSRRDKRAVHIVEVLKRKTGDTFDVGVVNGARGKATLQEITPANLHLSFSWSAPPPPLFPITLIIGLPRPQTARKILQEATALGVSAMHFVMTERGEPSYASSTLWTSGEWRRHLLTGAAQAFCTRIPTVTNSQMLDLLLPNTSAATNKIAMDNYEAPAPLASALRQNSADENSYVVIAIGSERGWTAGERDCLRAHQFTLAHLGSRVLRTETAVVAAVSIVRSTLGWF
ncbi:MAG: RsmE family RNA methyltransferase [Nibricoccus sp.]